MDYYNEIKNELIDNEINKKVKDYSKNNYELKKYYNVGKLIIEAQGGENRAKYGNKLIKEYSKRLTAELGRGYSERNLKYMRKFYLFQKGQTMFAQLSWSYYTILLSLNNINEVEYYIKITVEHHLSVRKLKERIKSKEYERLSDDTKEKLKDNKDIEMIELISDPILIKSNGINKDNIKEKTLKKLILVAITACVNSCANVLSR